MDNARLAEWLATSNLTDPYTEDSPDDFAYERRHLEDSEGNESDISSEAGEEEEIPVLSQPLSSSGFAGPSLPRETSKSYQFQKGHQFSHRRHRGELEEVEETEEDLDSDEEEIRKRSMRDFPKWFKPGPFLYNGRTFLASLPGILLTLATGGDFFLAVFTLGILVVYLFYQAGEKNKALFAYVIAFACCEMSVVYSALPFLWLSIFNIVLVASLNMYTVLTGAWGLMASKLFIYNDPELAKMLETCLFTFYPTVSIVLLTWLIVSLTKVTIAPYVVMVLGFIVFQFYMAPAPSSFYKVNSKTTENMYVLDPAVTGAMALVYIGATPFLFMIVTVYHITWKNFFLFSLITENLLEWVFLICVGVFLTTWMHLRSFLETSGFDYESLIKVRLGSGLVGLLLLSHVLQKYGFTIHLLPWISVGVAIHAAYGFLIKKRQKKSVSMLAAGGLLLLYVLIFYKLPWQINYFVGDRIHVSQVHMTLFVNVLLCIVCAYASVYFSKDALGALLTLQSIGFILCEKILLDAKLYSSSLVLLSGAFSVYCFLRLYYSEKLLWQHTWFCVSFHLTKLQELCISHSHLTSEPSPSYDLYSWTLTFILSLIVTKVMVFEKKKDISTKKWAVYMALSVLCNALAAPVLWARVYTQLMASLPSTADLFGMSMLVCGAVAGKLGFAHLCSWPGVKHSGPALTVMAVLMFQLQPEFDWTWEESRKWLVILNLVGCFGVIPLASQVKSVPLLNVLGQLLGFPLGIAIYAWDFSESLMWSYMALYGFTSGLCVSMMLLSWRAVNNLDAVLMVIYVLLMYCCSGFGALYALWPLEGAIIQPSLLAISVVQLVIAAVFKVLSFREKFGDLMSGEEETPLLPLWGNCATLAAYVMVCCFFNPGVQTEIWVCICSTLLLLLQRDSVLFCGISRSNNYAPILYTVTAALLFSSTFNSATFWYRNTLHFLQGCLELFVIVATLPVYFIFITVLWNSKFYISDRLVIFLSPINILLFFIGTSSQSVVLGMYGIVVGIWLAKFKLPLYVER